MGVGGWRVRSGASLRVEAWRALIVMRVWGGEAGVRVEVEVVEGVGVCVGVRGVGVAVVVAVTLEMTEETVVRSTGWDPGVSDEREGVVGWDRGEREKEMDGGNVLFSGRSSSPGSSFPGSRKSA